MSMGIDWKAMYEADELAIKALESAIASKDAALESAIRALKKIRARVGNYMEFRLYLRACEAIFTCQKALEDAK